MTPNEVSFNFKARYYKLVNTANIKHCWYAIHGYGQLAPYFIQKFKTLTEHNTCIIAPEGLSKFYLQGHQGRVGASWMTRENRLTDIENYIEYLDTIYQQEQPLFSNIPTTILGFSQGAATAVRWITHGKIKFDRLILWGGIFPPDMSFNQAHNLLAGKKVYLVYGTNDPFLTDEKFAEAKQINDKLGIEPQIITFNGGHDIDKDVLERLITMA